LFSNIEHLSSELLYELVRIHARAAARAYFSEILVEGTKESPPLTHIEPSLSTVCFDWFIGIAGASFGASHGRSMGLEGIEKWMESVSY